MEQAIPSDGRTPTRAVVVPCRDRAELLRDALDAIRGCLGPHDDLVVADSASTGPEVAAVAAAAGARVVRCEEPGVSRARNAGARAVDADVVVFVDDDCRPAPGWLDALVRPLVADPTLGFVTGAVLPDGDGPALSVDDRGTAERIVAGHPVEALGHSANLAVRRAVLLDVLGGFDEQMGSGAPLRAAEDADLQWRALHHGHDGHHEPAAVVRHVAWRGRAAALRQSRDYGVGAGALAVKTRRLAGGRPFRPASEALRHLGRDVRNGYAFGVLVSLARLVGVTRGVLAARRRTLVDERFGGRR